MDIPKLLGGLAKAVGEYGPAILAVVLIIAGIVGLVKVWPVLTKIIHIGNAVLLLPQMQKDLIAVKHEVLPNSGGSFRDDFTALSRRVDEHIKADGDRLKKVEGSVRSLHRKIQPLVTATYVDEDTKSPREIQVVRQRRKS